MSDGYRYACCVHCEHDDPTDDYHVNGHTEPCSEGCNDGEGSS